MQKSNVPLNTISPAKNRNCQNKQLKTHSGCGPGRRSLHNGLMRPTPDPTESAIRTSFLAYARPIEQAWLYRRRHRIGIETQAVLGQQESSTASLPTSIRLLSTDAAAIQAFSRSFRSFRNQIEEAGRPQPTGFTLPRFDFKSRKRCEARLGTDAQLTLVPKPHTLLLSLLHTGLKCQGLYIFGSRDRTRTCGNQVNSLALYQT